MGDRKVSSWKNLAEGQVTGMSVHKKIWFRAMLMGTSHHGNLLLSDKDVLP